jgi:6-methylsalicylate decarboxylase
MSPALPRRRIDVHHHFYPPEYIASSKSLTARAVTRDWTLARTIEEMDRNDIAVGVLSLSPPGYHQGTNEQNRALARAVNEHARKLRTEHPTRFGHFASVPMPDVDGTLAEIAYALDTLKADGIQLMTSYSDVWLGDAKFAPVFDELNRRKAVVFVHPLEPVCCHNLIEGVPPAVLEFPHDTTRTITSLLVTGTLARCPGIRFIFCHAGGTLPMMRGRMSMGGFMPKGAEVAPKGIDHELLKLHYDVALSANKPALAALFAFVPVSQVLLGTDYPFGATGPTLEGLAEYGLSEADLQAICRTNAERLVPRLKTLAG